MSIEYTLLGIDNSGLAAIYAMYILILVSPFFSERIALLYKIPEANVLKAFILLSGLAMMFLVKSRTGLIMSMAALTIVSFGKMRNKILFVWILGFSIVAFFLWFYEIDSSLGRLQILRIAFNQINSNEVSWFHGVGNFAYWYNPAQARYFSTHAINGKEALLADNTFFLFNDLLQFFLEKGFAAGAIILTLVLIYFKRAFKSIKHTSNKFIKGYHLSAISLLMSSLFYYPFQIGITYGLLGFTTILFFMQDKAIWKISFQFPLKYIFLSIGIAVLLGLIVIINQYKNYTSKRNEADANLKSGFLTKASSVYGQLSKSKFADGKMLYAYSLTLLSLNKLDSAFKVVNKSEHFFYSDGTSLLKAQILMSRENMDQAEVYFKEAVFINPKSFKNRLALISFYMSNGDTTHADFWCRQTLDLTEKIPSLRTAQIKRYIKSLLKNINSKQPTPAPPPASISLPVQ